ncbi:integrase arm-type DNA-binding domain-containing protein [Prosthecochloris sp.]|uniref:tyrosine-type recombinase/integrase n=1 Tax=Prosthecochloris sp. TaxID=290513 RepID=UPI0025FA9BE1|nr:integrase arm-type DNA-binding domain-containing protein [Prosthecochloris sp.]
MPIPIVPLSDTQIKRCKPQDKPYRLFDGGGLCLFIAVKGRKTWQYRYKFNGKSATMTLGVYPDVGLAKARELHRNARVLLGNGINPIEERKQQGEPEKQGTLFSTVAREWFEIAKSEWTEGHAMKIYHRLEKDVMPVLGNMVIGDITAQDVLRTLRFVEDRGAIDTAHRVKGIISQVFIHALVTGVEGIAANPAAGLSRVLRKPKVRHMPAITEASELARLLRSIDSYKGAYITKCALRLAPMLFVRPGELRSAEWEEINLDEAVWRIPANKTKTGEFLIVPLARQVIAILQDLKLFTGDDRYVFQGRVDNSFMSDNTLLKALRTLGWSADKVTIHGFRATARTFLHERLGFSPDAIEAQLGHRVPDRLGGAYNRTKHLEERIRMMQAWADYLDELK